MKTRICVLDFETYYSKEYSQSKMTTEEYIRDPRFQIIGVATRFTDEAFTRWVSFATLEEYANWLKPLNDCMVVCHNTMFDGAILSWRLGIRPKFLFDTLSMARPLHGMTVGGSLKALAEHYQIGHKGTEVLDALGKRLEDFTASELVLYGEYCKNDVELTYKLWKLLGKGFPVRELQLVDQTLRLFVEPVLKLDTAMLELHLSGVRQKKEMLLDKVLAVAGKDALMSNPQFAEVLQSLGVEPPTKVSLRTGKLAYAFSKSDKGFTELLEHDDPRVQAVVSARLGVKSTLEETRTERFIGMSQRGMMPIPLNYCGAIVTSRWSGADKVNFQNLPRGGTLRNAIQAPDGYQLVASDSSNIELRVNHCLAGQTDSVEALRNGHDLYCEFASKLYGREITKADKAERQHGKMAQLGLGYGMGWTKFKETCRQQKVILDDAEAERTVRLWRDTYTAIPEFWKNADKALAAMARGAEMAVDACGLVKTAEGKLLTPPANSIIYPSLRRSSNGWEYSSRRGKSTETVRLFGPKVVENICQHLARNIIAEQWLRIATRYRVVLQVHDEIVCVVPEDEVEAAAAFMVEVMSTSPDWWPDIPLAAEAAYGKTYADCK